MEKYKKFIEKVYNGEICFSVVDFKEIIEGAFPGEFYSPKIGDWVWIKSDQSWNNLEILVYFNGFDSESDTYGFATMKNWVNNFRISSFHTGIKITKATDKEVTDALTAEAKKRGFKEGVTIIPVGCKNPQKITNPFSKITNPFSHVDVDEINTYSPMSEWHNNYSNPPIYKNGVWASIVEQQTELTLEQIAEKFNINVGDLRIKGASGEANRPFKEGDLVEITGDSSYHRIPNGTICRISKSFQREYSSWCMDYMRCERFVYESDMKHSD